MIYDISSFLNTLLLVFLVNVILESAVLGKCRKWNIRSDLMTFLYWIVIFRLLLPAHFIAGIPFPFSRLFSVLDTYFSKPVFEIFSGYALLQLIWLLGFMVELIRYRIRFRKDRIFADAMLDAAEVVQIRDLISDYAGPSYPVYVTDEVPVPFVFGLSGKIILPDKPYSEDELYYILSHETMHLFNQDGHYLQLADYLRMVYWWVPGMKAFKKNVSGLVEIRVDECVLSHYSIQDLIGYCETMVKMSRKEDTEPQNFIPAVKGAAMPFTAGRSIGDQSLKARVTYALNDSSPKTTSRWWFALCLVTLALICLTTFEFQFAGML